jgi:hypothetical protein
VERHAPLHVAADPRRLAVRIADDDLLIQFSDEGDGDREFRATGEVQGHLVDHLVVPPNQIRDAAFLLPDKLRCAENPWAEFAGERARGHCIGHHEDS